MEINAFENLLIAVIFNIIKSFIQCATEEKQK